MQQFAVKIPINSDNFSIINFPVNGDDDGRLLNPAAGGIKDGAQLGLHVESVIGSTVG
jgi:hypothetical protein